MLVDKAYIENRIKNPAGHGIKEIKVLRDKEGELPVNEQIGPTCAIYALHAAITIKNGKCRLARKNVYGDWRTNTGRAQSMRELAKDGRLSQIGEIGSVDAVAVLADACGIDVAIERFGSETELWTIIQKSVKSGQSIVFPYNCKNDYGEPAWKGGFAHWCLLFGYYVYSQDSRSVFMTTYAYYNEVSPFLLFKGNQCMEDFPEQRWIKVPLWQKKPGAATKWEFWKSEWMAAETVVADLKEFAKGTGGGWGLAIGGSKEGLVALVDPGKMPKLNDPDVQNAVTKATLKAVDFKEIKYTLNARGRCVIV